jgi:hypothetical protein
VITLVTQSLIKAVVDAYGWFVKASILRKYYI